MCCVVFHQNKLFMYVLVRHIKARTIFHCSFPNSTQHASPAFPLFMSRNRNNVTTLTGSTFQKDCYLPRGILKFGLSKYTILLMLSSWRKSSSCGGSHLLSKTFEASPKSSQFHSLWRTRNMSQSPLQGYINGTT